MSFVLSFNAHTVAPNVTQEPLPTNQYPVMITDTKETLVKDGNGASFYEITMQVAAGEYQGRKIIERLNVKNTNAQAVEIAYSTLSSICYVTGVMVIQQSSAELHGKPFIVSVVKEPRRDDPTKYSNRIVAYMDTMGNEPGKAPASQQQAPAFAQQPVQQQQQQQQQPQQQQAPQTQVVQQTPQTQVVQQAPQTQVVQQAPQTQVVQQAPQFAAPPAGVDMAAITGIPQQQSTQSGQPDWAK